MWRFTKIIPTKRFVYLQLVIVLLSCKTQWTPNLSGKNSNNMFTIKVNSRSNCIPIYVIFWSLNYIQLEKEEITLIYWQAKLVIEALSNFNALPPPSHYVLSKLFIIIPFYSFIAKIIKIMTNTKKSLSSSKSMHPRLG